jgi:hypothetical protein
VKGWTYRGAAVLVQIPCLRRGADA